ncbi:MAG: hypothetical protein Q9183_004593 [Haloplaca sp. 2 TL-2023]
MSFLRHVEKSSLFDSIYDDDGPEDNDPYWYRPSLKCGYQFRLGPRDPNLPMPSDPADEDETGTFDPDRKAYPEFKFLKEKRERTPSLFGEDEDDIDENEESGASREPREKRPRIHTWQNGRYNGLSLPIVLKLGTSEKAKILLGSHLNNWPVEERDEDSVPAKYEDLWLRSLERLSKDRGKQESIYNIRPRNVTCLTAPYSNSSQRRVSDDPINIHNMTLGHPAARGCIACLQIGLPCSLLEEGGTYPCQSCVEDHCDCELVIEPPRKRACERCRGRRFLCSYALVTKDEDDKIFRSPCDECQKTGFKCLAGPVTGRTRVGPSLDQDLTGKQSKKVRRILPILGERRKYVECTHCRKAKKRCPLRNGGDPPCTRCKNDSVTCDFQSLRPATKKCPSPSSNETQVSNNVTEENPADTLTRTRLANPIVFNCGASSPSPIQTQSLRCHFCSDILYPLLGIAKPETTDQSQAQGSTMCTACTVDRIQIIACDEHSLVPLDGTDSDTFPHERVTEYLLSDEPEKECFWEWCSICPSAAFWGCGGPSTFPPPVDLADVKNRNLSTPNLQSPPDPENGNIAATEKNDVSATNPNTNEKTNTKNHKGDLTKGCGLRFCDDCAEMLIECHGSLDTLIERRAQQAAIDDDLFMVRADAGLLLRVGASVGAMVGN